MTRPLDPRRRPYRPRRAVRPIAQPIGRHAFRGWEIFDEYPGAPGYLLWVTFRDADLWVATGGRPEVFAEGAEDYTPLIGALPEEPFRPVVPPLTLLSRLHLREAVEAADVALGCDAIAEWSERQSRLATAVEYAQVASFAHPRHAPYAVRAARVLRMRAEWARALSWFDHAIFLARTQADWDSYCSAYTSLGFLYMERGSLPQARRALKRALRIALRLHLDERSAGAYHNLFIIEVVAGNWERAESYVTKALAKYPEGSRFRPRLARDLAYRWILRGRFACALPLAQEILHHFSAPADRALVWSDIVRAAAGAGDLETFENAWARAWVFLEAENIDPFRTTILLNLAHGAASVGADTRAVMSARRALDVARERQESQSVLEAEALLGSLDPMRNRFDREHQQETTSDHLAELFIRTLRIDRMLA